MPRQPPIPCKRPTQPALPRMTRNLASQPCNNNQALQHNGARRMIQRAVEQLQDRHIRRRSRDFRKVTHDAEEHGDAVEPGGREADGDGAKDRDRDHTLRLRDFFRQVRRAVQTREGPIGIDEADDEGDAVGFPACVIDEGREDEAGLLVGRRDGGDGDEDDEKGEEGCVEGGCGDFGERLAVAVEKEAEGVYDLVGNEDVPCFNYAAGSQSQRRWLKRH